MYTYKTIKIDKVVNYRVGFKEKQYTKYGIPKDGLTYTSTQFTIHADQDPGQDVDFAWKAIIL